MATMYAKDQPDGFTNRIERVAIMGATGNIGRYIVEHLLKTGKHTITAITRTNSPNSSKIPSGVHHVVAVDYNDNGTIESSLESAFQNQQCVIVALGVSAGVTSNDPTLFLKIIRAAAKAQVPYIFPNWFGMHSSEDAPPPTGPSFLNQQIGPLVTEIEKLGVSSYFLLVCSMWYEWSLGGGTERFGFDFEKRTLNLYDDGKTVINTTTWPRCGQAIANLLSLKEFPDDENDKSPSLAQFRNKPVYISSFLVSQTDMFESVKRVTGTTDDDWTITRQPVEEAYMESKEAWGKDRTDMAALARFLYTPMFYPGGWAAYETRGRLDNAALGLLDAEDLDEYTGIAIRMGLNGEVVVS